MNDILLQKILDLLRDGLAHVGNFFKDLFISDPQDGQIIAYDAESGHWVNKDAAEVELDLTNTFEAQAIATITDGAENVPMKSLIVDIVPKQASGTPTPDNPLPISGSDEVVITHTYGDNETETKTITLPSTVYGGEDDITTGNLRVTSAIVTLDGNTPETDLNVTVVSNFTQVGYIPYMLVGKGDEDFVSDTLENATLATRGVGKIWNNKNTSSVRMFIGLPSTVTTAAEAVAWFATYPTTIVYQLATSIPIATTPTTIKTKGGTESIFADTGDVSGEYYTKTAESVINLANITEDITGTITKNTTDFSDILFKASQNNKVVSVEIYSASTSAAVNANFLSGLPKPAMNSKILLVNTTLGEDGIILGTLKTTGELDITTSSAKTFSGLITYVAK